MSASLHSLDDDDDPERDKASVWNPAWLLHMREGHDIWT